MKHYPLKRVYHMADSGEVERQYNERLGSPGTIRWDFQVGDWPLFCCVTAELSAKVERIFTYELDIARLWAELPAVARRHYLFNLLLSEVVATNEIEGIHSTRREVAEALEKMQGGSKHKRLHEFSQLYFRLAHGGQLRFPATLRDLRELYDQLLASEISPDDRPDGELFRASTVTITDGLKEIHRGVTPTKIELALTQFLATADADSNRLIQILVGHFMFEYVHPFYDGNGRLGRFLLSAALRRTLSAATALTISRQLSDDKVKYYRAFAVTEEPMNRGEATYFVDAMVDMLLAAQQFLLEELEVKQSQLANLEQSIAGLGKDLPENEVGALSVLAQGHLFGPDYGIDLGWLADSLGKDKRTARKYVADLEERGLVTTMSRRPLRFRLTPAGLRLLGL